LPNLTQEEKRQFWNVLNHEVAHDVEEDPIHFQRGGLARIPFESFSGLEIIRGSEAIAELSQLRTLGPKKK
jgi:hypothetical protein